MLKPQRDLRLLRIEEQEQPDDPFTLFNLGAVLSELNQPAEALAYLRRSLQRSHPGDSIVRKLYSLIAQCHQHLGSIDAALEALIEGRALYPKDAELLFMQGTLRSAQGDRLGAIELFKELLAGEEQEHLASVAIGLRSYKARHQLAMIYLQLKDHAQAEEQWKEVLREEPAFFLAHLGLAELALLRQEWAELNAHSENLRRFGALGEEEAEALLGRAKFERQQYSSARFHFSKALQRFPQSLNLRVLHSHAILKEGIDELAAEEALRQVLILAPDHPIAKSNLQALLVKRGTANSATNLTPSRIFVLCPDNNAPSGGVRRLYRHVDVLCARGLPAFILHERPGFRCDWFANSTPVLAMGQTVLKPTDYLVVPEIFAPGLVKLAPGVPKVIFNQNAYFTFRGWLAEGLNGTLPYRHPDVVATFCVSEDNLEYLRFAFPDLPARRLHYGIDPLFAPSWPKRRAIAFMPRKNAQEVEQVLNILRSRGSLAGWELVAIDGLPETSVAEILGSSSIFLSFGHPEGCPLPPLEAMASGCVVVGYHGRGGREYFDPAFTYPVESGDIIGFARAVEEALRRERVEPGTLERLGKRASENVRANYSPERESRDIIECWRTILSVRRQNAQPEH